MFDGMKDSDFGLNNNICIYFKIVVLIYIVIFVGLKK